MDVFSIVFDFSVTFNLWVEIADPFEWVMSHLDVKIIPHTHQ